MAAYEILSPDGFTIEFGKSYSSMEEARQSFEQWKKRYEGQGYYSSVKYGRIPLSDLEHYCTLIEL